MLKGIEGLGSGDDSNASVETLLQQKNRRLETQIVQSKEALAGSFFPIPIQTAALTDGCII